MSTEQEPSPEESQAPEAAPEQMNEPAAPEQTEAPAPESAVAVAEAPASEAPAAPPAKAAMSDDELKRVLECLLFITDRPLTVRELTKACGLTVKENGRVAGLVEAVKQELDGRGAPYQALEVADGWQMSTRREYAPFVRKIFAERMTMKLSTAAHETLSIVAYKQPITRAEIEEIRGVEVIAALETLVEKRLIKVVGRKESVGRPLMYGTTIEFLRHFGLRALEDLPVLDSFQPQPENAAAPAEPGADAVPEPPAEPSADAAEQPEASAEPQIPAAPEPEAQPEPEVPSEPEARPEPSPEEPKKKSLWDD